MTDWRIIIPSYKRAGKVRSAKLFPDGTAEVWVQESQLQAYADAQPELTLVGIPDDEDGRGMAIKRNAILKRTSGDLVMVDDDVRGYGRWQDGVCQQLDPDDVGAMVDLGFDLATRLDVALWSPNIKADPRAYSRMRPFSLLAPVLGPFTGINRAKLGARRYDVRFPLKEDYDFWLQAIYHDRRTLRLNQFCIVKRDEQAGGLARSMDDERAQNQLLMQKWGDVIRYNDKKSVLDGRVQIPIAGC